MTKAAPKASSGSYPELQPDKPKVKKACGMMTKEMKAKKMKKSIDRLQGLLARIQKMDETARAAVLENFSTLIEKQESFLDQAIGRMQKMTSEMLDVEKGDVEKARADHGLSEKDKVDVRQARGARLMGEGGYHQRGVHEPNVFGAAVHRFRGTTRQSHAQVMSEMRSQPNPKLPKDTQKTEDVEKARVDEGKTPQEKATARTARNVRHHYDPGVSRSGPSSSASYEHGYTPHPGGHGSKVEGFPAHTSNIHYDSGSYSAGTPRHEAAAAHGTAMEEIRSSKFKAPK